jgi:cyanate permease
MSSETNNRQYRWVILALLWLLYVSFGLVSRSIFPLVTPILNDLKLSYSQMGVILGSWQLTYILVAMAGGTILDRWGVRKSIFAGALVIGLSAAVRYFANDFLTMLIAVALFGVGGPMISIGGPKTISAWFKSRKRGTAIGIYTTGTWIGALLALSLTNSLVMPMVGNSWRLAFVCFGMLTVAVSFLWLFLAKEATDSPTSSAGMGIIEVFRKLIEIRNVQILLIMALFSFAIGHGFSSWLPKIFENTGMLATNAGFAASIPIAAGIPAILFIPSLIRPRLRSWTIATFALLATVTLLLIMKTNGPALYISLIIFGFVSTPFLPLMLLILMDTPDVKSDYMGSAGGMFFCIAEIGGFSGPLLMGVLVDVTGTFLTGALFLASLCILMSILTMFLEKN